MGEIQPDHGIAEYTTDLIDLLNVLGLLIDLEPEQASQADLLSADDLEKAAALADPQYPPGFAEKTQTPAAL